MACYQSRVKLISCFFIFGLWIVGCAPTGIYQWGDYEKNLYKRFIKPGSMSTREEIMLLENQLQKTYSETQIPPPGLHVHLGYLYSEDGQFSRALEHFNIEKKRFPESTHFIDGLITRMKK